MNKKTNVKIRRLKNRLIFLKIVCHLLYFLKKKIRINLNSSIKKIIDKYAESVCFNRIIRETDIRNAIINT